MRSPSTHEAFARVIGTLEDESTVQLVSSMQGEQQTIERDWQPLYQIAEAGASVPGRVGWTCCGCAIALLYIADTCDGLVNSVNLSECYYVCLLYTSPSPRD